MRFPFYPLLLTIASLFLALSFARASESPVPLSYLQYLAHSTDTVVSARVVRVEPGTVGRTGLGGYYVEGTDTRATCLVDEVYIGDVALKDTEITVTYTAADNPLAAAPSPLLLFLRSEHDVFVLPYAHGYGAFPLRDGNVDCWFEGKEPGDCYSLEETLQRVIQYRAISMAASVSLPDTVSLKAGVLPVTFTFRNTGAAPADVLPPSHTFNGLIARRLARGRWNARRDPWTGIGHWDFLLKPEPVLTVQADAQATFTYDIPLAALAMDRTGEYRVDLRYLTQDSHWYTLYFAQQPGLDPAANPLTWLGVVEWPPVRVTVTR